MAHDGSSAMVNQLRAWVEERFLSLHDTYSEREEKNVALSRYRELTIAIRQLEKLKISVPEELESEKVALDEFLHRPSEEESKLDFLSKELSSLAKDINHRLRSMRGRQAPKGQKISPRRLRVEFSDGTIIDEPRPTDTFVDSIRRVGLQRVSELPTNKDGVRLVSTQEPTSPREARKFRKIDGYFINTHSGTNVKARYIQRIADALQLDISVSIVD